MSTISFNDIKAISTLNALTFSSLKSRAKNAGYPYFLLFDYFKKPFASSGVFKHLTALLKGVLISSTPQ